MNSDLTMKPNRLEGVNATSFKSGKKIVTVLSLSVMILCGFLTSFVPLAVVDVAVLLCCVLLFLTGDLYLAYPVMLFFYEPFGLFLVMSVYRYYSFLLIFSYLIALAKGKRHIKVNWDHLPIIAIFFLYCMVVLVPYSVQTAAFAFLDILILDVLVSERMQDMTALKRFYSVFFAAAVVAFFTGLFSSNVHTQAMAYSGEYYVMDRMQATFEDPNYMGFFFTLAIFGLVTLKIFPYPVRVVSVIALYVMMLASLSLTAVVINLLLWFAYLLVAGKWRMRYLIIALLVGAALYALYSYGLSHRDAEVIGPLAIRIQHSITSFLSGDVNAATSNRTSNVDAHFQYFLNTDIWHKLFGFHAASTVATNLGGMTFAAHNEYVDMLLNVGIIGTLVFLGFELRGWLRALRNYRSHHDERHLFAVMAKTTWFLYAVTLTLFMDHRFLIAFLL